MDKDVRELLDSIDAIAKLVQIQAWTTLVNKYGTDGLFLFAQGLRRELEGDPVMEALEELELTQVYDVMVRLVRDPTYRVVILDAFKDA